jgi:mannose-6-phosphate isomerase-like protein (cupin superfamily)
MNRGEKFSLSGMRIHLSDGPGVQPLHADKALWQRMTSDRALSAGRMSGVEAVRTNDDVHASKWERHPNGDELLCVVSGRIDVVLEEPSGERVIPLEPLSALIVPQGVWHRLLVKEPAVLVGVTRPADTQLRDVKENAHVDGAVGES